jgi:hypothetical protein
MRAGSGVKHWIIFQHDDCRFDGISSRASAVEHRPTSLKRAPATLFARRRRFLGN